MTSTLGLIAVGAYAGFTTALLGYLNSVHPEPYMDEEFHIPQAQKYCYGNFKEWDDKITTLPGLYVVSIGLLNPISRWTGRIACDPVHLRLLNVVLGSAMCLVLQRLSSQIHGAKHFFVDWKSVWSALNMSVFPVLYFFNFLYYTDVGSTFMVLLMYCLHLDGRDWFASFIGALAVLFRQTNVVWVVFVAVLSVEPHLLHLIHASQVERGARFGLTTRGQVLEVIEGLYRLAAFREERPRLRDLLLRVVPRASGGYILVVLGFAAFVLANGGIVVGDRAAHTATFHPTQVFYFLTFSLAFGGPFLVTRARVAALWRFSRRHWASVLAACAIAGFLVDSYTLVHPYLLADNRHYTFYLWRRVISSHRFLLLPVHLFAAFCLLHSLRRASVLFKMAFPVFVIVSLVPQLLLEFRYFVIPYLLFRLQVRPVSWQKLAMESAIHVAVNLATVWIYVRWPFEWPSEPGKVQRFIW